MFRLILIAAAVGILVLVLWVSGVFSRAGKPLPAHSPSLDFQQRGASFTMPADRPWQEVLKWQEEYERSQPLAVPA